MDNVGTGNYVSAASISGSAWTFAGDSGIAANGSTLSNPNAPEGTQAAFIQDSGQFSQTITFSAAGTYTIGFQAAYYGSNGADTFQVRVNGQTDTFTPTTNSTYQSYYWNTVNISAGGQLSGQLRRPREARTRPLSSLACGSRPAA